MAADDYQQEQKFTYPLAIAIMSLSIITIVLGGTDPDQLKEGFKEWKCQLKEDWNKITGDAEIPTPNSSMTKIDSLIDELDGIICCDSTLKNYVVKELDLKQMNGK